MWPLTSDECYVSVDIETDGSTPGPYSMLSLGAAAFDADGYLHDTWSTNLERLADASEHPRTMRWWAAHSHAWAGARADGHPQAIDLVGPDTPGPGAPIEPELRDARPSFAQLNHPAANRDTPVLAATMAQAVIDVAWDCVSTEYGTPGQGSPSDRKEVMRWLTVDDEEKARQMSTRVAEAITDPALRPRAQTPQGARTRRSRMQQTPTHSGRPAPARVREVATQFHRAAKRHGIVYMAAPHVMRVPKDDTCDTVACVAAHYMLQRAIDKLETDEADAEGAATRQAVADRVDWKRGTRMIANELGIENEEHPMGWTEANPQLWGNEENWEMFYEEYAYEFSGPTLTLSDSARHWDRVANQLEAPE